MNDKTQKLLQTVELPDVHLSAHQKALRRKLLIMHTPQRKKGGDVPIMKKKLFRYAAVGLFSLVLITVFSVTTMMSKTPQVEAQEIVNDAMDHVIRLSDEQRKVLEERIKSDLKGSLAEAKQAKDLTVVPEDEIQRIDPPAHNPGDKDVFLFKTKQSADINRETEDVQFGAAKDGPFKPGTRVEFSGKVMAPHGVKVLRYTNPDGKKVILGINEQNEPVMKMIFISKEDVKGLESRQEIRFERAL